MTEEQLSAVDRLSDQLQQVAELLEMLVLFEAARVEEHSALGRAMKRRLSRYSKEHEREMHV